MCIRDSLPPASLPPLLSSSQLHSSGALAAPPPLHYRGTIRLPPCYAISSTIIAHGAPAYALAMRTSVLT
eukprot:1993750-Rhodomonas_salina.3